MTEDANEFYFKQKIKWVWENEEIAYNKEWMRYFNKIKTT